LRRPGARLDGRLGRPRRRGVESRGERRGALAKLRRLGHETALLQPLGAAEELLAAPLGGIRAHRDLHELLREIVVVRREEDDLLDCVERRFELVPADRAFGELEVVDLRIAEEPLLGVELTQGAVNLEILLRDAEDLLADGDRVLVELRLAVFLDGLTVAADRLRHGAPLGQEIRDEDEVVRILVAALKELLELGESGVDLPLLHEGLSALLDGEATVHASP
jgi:hypothetical protein